MILSTHTHQWHSVWSCLIKLETPSSDWTNCQLLFHGYESESVQRERTDYVLCTYWNILLAGNGQTTGRAELVLNYVVPLCSFFSRKYYIQDLPNPRDAAWHYFTAVLYDRTWQKFWNPISLHFTHWEESRVWKLRPIWRRSQILLLQLLRWMVFCLAWQLWQKRRRHCCCCPHPWSQFYRINNDKHG